MSVFHHGVAGGGVRSFCVPRAAAIRPVTTEKITVAAFGSVVLLPVATIEVVRHPPALMMKSVSADTIRVIHR
jgi:hypothetical protein